MTFTKLTDTNNGCIKLSGVKIIWGTVHSAVFSKNTTIGGYDFNIDLTSYKLTGSLYTNISCSYSQGIAKVGFVNVSNTAVKLACSSAISGLWIRWLVIGACTD